MTKLPEIFLEVQRPLIRVLGAAAAAAEQEEFFGDCCWRTDGLLLRSRAGVRGSGVPSSSVRREDQGPGGLQRGVVREFGVPELCVSTVERYLMSGITISKKWRFCAKNAKRCK